MGKTTSKQRIHRNLLDCFISISNWSLFCLAVLLYKKNPARFIVLILTIAVYLVWMLVINRININQMEKIYFLFFFDLSLFFLAFSILCLPIFKASRSLVTLAIKAGLFAGIIGIHLLIYGQLWYQVRFVILMIAPIAAFLIACSLIRLLLRGKKSTCKYIFIFIILNVLSSLLAVMICVASLYIHQAVTSYSFRFTRHNIFDYEMRFAYFYFLIFYAALIPFGVFICKNRFYRNILLGHDTAGEIHAE